MLIQLRGITKTYRMGDVSVQALRGVELDIAEGDMTAIMGPSGSGKSTMMNLLGCLDRPTTGQYLLAGTDVSRLNDNELAEIRNKRLGFVFQSYNLLPRTTALANVEIPLVYAGKRQRHRLALAALESVGLADRLHHRPNELSGGEQQRVAIARALVNEPRIILADEPTGNLDSKTSEEIMKLFDELHRQGNTIITVTHEAAIARHAHRVLSILDGRIDSDESIPEDQRNGMR